MMEDKQMGERRGPDLDSNRYKTAAEWFRNVVYRDEAISRRPAPRREKLPPLLTAARSLETGRGALQLSREALFVKQAKLLENYEDDFSYSAPVQRYFPTYQSLTDPELRGYFTWRTKLRRGQVEKASLSFAYLYLYELINGVGMTDPLDGYRKLEKFREDYGALDSSILWYLDTWMADFVIYYNLDPALLNNTNKEDKLIETFEQLPDRTDGEILDAVGELVPGCLARSRFYKSYPQDMERVVVRVLRKMHDHYSRCKHTLTEQLFGNRTESPVWLFSSAVFLREKKEESRVYRVSPVRCYRCRHGLWFLEQYDHREKAPAQLRSLIRTVDTEMRALYDFPYPLKPQTCAKWLVNVIREETQELLAEKKAAESKKITIDYSRLDRIRRDAAFTQDRLMVDDEEEPEIPEALPEPEATQAVQEETFSLDESELRLLRCLLYGGDLGWVRQSGKILSVLADGINEKLYDAFSDAVLTLDEPPEIVEDYIDDLKEMVHP